MNDVLKQPLSLGAVLKKAWLIFSENLMSILIITLATSVPLNIIETYFLPSQDRIFDFGFVHFFIYGFVIPVLLGFISVLSILAIVFVTKGTLRLEKINYRTAFSLSLSRWINAIKTDIVASVISLLAMILLFIPVIIVGVYMVLSTQVVALKNKDGMAALRYSESLVRGNWWKIFGYFAIFYLVSIGPSVMLEVVLELFTKSPAVQLISYTMGDILYSIFVIIPSTIIFLNLDYAKNPQDYMVFSKCVTEEGCIDEPYQWLEFRYKRINSKKEVLLVVTILVAWLLIILWSSDIVSMVFLLLSAIMAWRYYEFYTKERSAIVRLNEDFVTYRKANNEIKIRWDEVKKIEFKGYGKENLHSLVIDSGISQIQIGTEIIDFHRIVDFAKQMLGDKFDTTTIPMEYKFKQR